MTSTNKLDRRSLQAWARSLNGAKKAIRYDSILRRYDKIPNK
jgi:hypothetical protein